MNESGFSLGIPDFILDASIRNEVELYEEEYRNTTFSDQDERIDFWGKKTEDIKKRLSDRVSSDSLRALLQSKAAKVELGQLSGMRGIMMRPGGGYVAYPVCSNIVDGMTPLEYFISCHGSRQGLSDKGLITAPAGDLTNVLVQAAHAEFIVEEDCGTEHGLWISDFRDPQGGFIPLEERIIGRFPADPLDLGDGRKIGREDRITAELAKEISRAGLKEVKIRSPLVCQGVNTRTWAWKNFVREAEGKLLTSQIAADDFAWSTAAADFRMWYSGSDSSRTDQSSKPEPVILDEAALLSIARMGIPAIEVHDSETGSTRVIPVPVVNGICRKCYGLDLASGSLPEVGYPAGVIAAQSIGEPGTQLALRTFHTGGTAGQEISQGLITARKAFFSGRIEKQPLKSGMEGQAVIVSSGNGLNWLEVQGGGGAAGEYGAQRFPIMGHDPISGWTKEMEGVLSAGKILSYIETHQDDGTRSFRPHGVASEFKTVQKGVPFPVFMGQRLFFPKRYAPTTTVAVSEVCRIHGPMAAAEYLLHVLQKIYNANNKVADHHFEVVLRPMLKELKVVKNKESNPAQGETLSLLHYLALSRKPAVSLTTLLQAASNAPGFLGRLAFRWTAHHLASAALMKETDWLVGLKEKIIAGQVRKKS